MTTVRTGSALDAAAVRHAVDVCLDTFLAAKTRDASDTRLPATVPDLLRGFLAAGGKRLRPWLCVVGWHAAGGGECVPTMVVRAAASLELFHAFALIHDDIMDNSDTRRGRPALHRAVAAQRAASGGRDPDRFGLGVAILAGDLALTWSSELLHTADVPSRELRLVLAAVDAMHTEVMYGQYADLEATGRPHDDVEHALDIAGWKTAGYTFRWPVRIGAVLAGAEPEFLAALDAYALPMGEAFQLRDDLLGVFGTPDRTGKSASQDLREGKPTVLLALALRRAGHGQRRLLLDLLADPELDAEGTQRVRGVLLDTGARTIVEDMIAARHRQALNALRAVNLPSPVEAVLQHLAAELATRVL